MGPISALIRTKMAVFFSSTPPPTLLVSSLVYTPHVAETWWDAGGIFACPDADSFSARCQNQEGHSPLAIHTAEFVHVLVLLAAGFALCFGESINLT